MSKVTLALALSCITASVAVAKNFCLVIDNDSSGIFTDSQIVLQKAKLGPRNVAPLQGYFAQFDSFSGTYSQFYPLSGQSIVSSTGNGALWFVVHHVDVGPSSSGLGTGNFEANLLCQPGSDGKIGLLDSCTGIFGNGSLTGHFIDCGAPVAIP